LKPLHYPIVAVCGSKVKRRPAILRLRVRIGAAFKKPLHHLPKLKIGGHRYWYKAQWSLSRCKGLIDFKPC
jgi:hypothetical protein